MEQKKQVITKISIIHSIRFFFEGFILLAAVVPFSYRYYERRSKW